MREQQIKERPIIFSAPMVRAILEGRKTQTRRVKKGSYWRYDCTTYGPIPDSWYWKRELQERPTGPVRFCAYDSPYGMINDRLWVREAFCCHWGYPGWGAPDLCRVVNGHDLPPIKQRDGSFYEPEPNDCMTVWYRAENEKPPHLQWKPSRVMPHWASRITLKIDRVIVCRLQTIEDRDAIAEGIRELPLQEGHPGAWWAADQTRPELHGRSPVDAYAKLWRSIHGPDSWDANPWVWVLSFHKLEAQP